jgi:hypothetical protein
MGTCNCFNPKLGGCAACNPMMQPINVPSYTIPQVTFANTPSYSASKADLREQELDLVKQLMLLAKEYERKWLYKARDDCEAFAKQLLAFHE